MKTDHIFWKKGGLPSRAPFLTQTFQMLYRSKKLVAVLALTFSSTVPAAAEPVRVIDGDTIAIGSVTYRLHGIDAPEAGQRCRESGSGTWPCGKAAILKLEALVEGRAIVCDNRGSDEFDRTIAVCAADDVDVNAEMVRTGHAWAFRKFSQGYISHEREARIDRVGVFQAETQTPWAYRAARWEVAAQVSPDGCPIKGNISRNGRIYHAPWSPWYTRTKLSIDKGERWFCSEREALDAGWRAPHWGR